MKLSATSHELGAWTGHRDLTVDLSGSTAAHTRRHNTARYENDIVDIDLNGRSGPTISTIQ
jgi:hypothetical protein